MHSPVAAPQPMPANTRRRCATSCAFVHTAVPPATRKMPPITSSRPTAPSQPIDSSSSTSAPSDASSGPVPRATGYTTVRSLCAYPRSRVWKYTRLANALATTALHSATPQRGTAAQPTHRPSGDHSSTWKPVSSSEKRASPPAFFATTFHSACSSAAAITRLKAATDIAIQPSASPATPSPMHSAPAMRSPRSPSPSSRPPKSAAKSIDTSRAGATCDSGASVTAYSTST